MGPRPGGFDLKTGHDAIDNITLVSDYDQLRDHWVKKPLDCLTGAHLAPDGETFGEGFRRS